MQLYSNAIPSNLPKTVSNRDFNTLFGIPQHRASVENQTHAKSGDECSWVRDEQPTFRDGKIAAWFVECTLPQCNSEQCQFSRS
jgi:hypothetical protein